MKIKNIVTVFLIASFLASCAPTAKVVPTETAISTSTFTPAPTATATITPIPAPENIADAKDLSKWVDEFVHAYGDKITVNGVEMVASQLTDEIKNNQEKFTQVKRINGSEIWFIVVNGAPLVIREGNGQWQESTMKSLGTFTGLKIGALIDDNKKLLDWWGTEYHNGAISLSLRDSMSTDSLPINFDWTNYQSQIADRNGIETRLQAVLFPGDMPLWAENGFTQDDLDNMVQVVVENAKKHNVTEIVVVNETGAPPDERKDLYWQKFGIDYVIRAFKLAREIYPEAKLIFNDANNHLQGYVTTKSTLMITRSLYQEELVDYVGVEMHIDQYNLPKKDDMIEIFRQYPVPVVITEYDALLTFLPENKRDEKFNEITKIVFDGCLESKVCLGITTWGANDSVGWNGRSLLRDTENRRKQAYYVAMQSMYEHLP